MPAVALPLFPSTSTLNAVLCCAALATGSMDSWKDIPGARSGFVAIARTKKRLCKRSQHCQSHLAPVHVTLDVLLLSFVLSECKLVGMFTVLLVLLDYLPG